MKLTKKLKQVQKENKAMLAANFYNFETCKGISQAAGELNQPVILQLTPASIKYMGLETAVSIARTVSSDEKADSWIHLDHCKDIELIKKCLDVGFDSVMIDASDKIFEENIKITSTIVELAKSYDINVEAELGNIPDIGSEINSSKYTDPYEAKLFSDQTGINALAVAIGSKHGFYRDEPELDFERLKEIRKSTDVCLVLHGCSGILDSSLQKAIKLGIVKVNIATAIKDIFSKH